MKSRSMVWTIVVLVMVFGALLSGCVAPTPQVIEKEKVVTQVVEKTVVQTQVVETQKEVEKVVTATPEPVVAVP